MAQVQEDQYTYDDTNNYYHNENYRDQPRDCRPYRGKIQVNTIKTHAKANIRAIAIKVIITKVIVVYIITHAEFFNRAITMANLEAEAIVMAEVITTDAVMVGPIIEAITTTNTISIMVMMMITRQINMVHHVHYVVVITTPPNIIIRKSMISMT